MQKVFALVFVLLALAAYPASAAEISPGRHDRLHHRAGNRWGKFRPTRCRYCRQHIR